MGGCKCTFRNCTNTTANSPGMHFFHYPLKDRERYEMWAKYANTQEILKLPFCKARNKVICETHFKDDCFMNYKKDRLVHSAVPTIIRLGNDLCLDYENSENPSPKSLAPPNKPHLIRPMTEEKKVDKYILGLFNGDDLEHQLTQNIESSSFSSGSDALALPLKTPPPKILNSCFTLSNNLKTTENAVQTNSSVEIFNDDDDAISVVFEDSIVHKSDQDIIQFIDNEENFKAIETRNSNDTEHFKETIEIINNVDNNIQDNLTYESAENKNSKIINVNYQNSENIITTNTTNRSNLNGIFLHNRKRKLEIHHEQSKEECPEKIKLKTNFQANSESSSAISHQTPLTKIQLFSSIKKYLSPSMATLVRMEMFGGPDREWKKDEKQVSIELLRLGDEVFKYVRDEWRFRLPPLKSVEKWLNEHIVKDKNL